MLTAPPTMVVENAPFSLSLPLFSEQSRRNAALPMLRVPPTARSAVDEQLARQRVPFTPSAWTGLDPCSQRTAPTSEPRRRPLAPCSYSPSTSPKRARRQPTCCCSSRLLKTTPGFSCARARRNGKKATMHSLGQLTGRNPDLEQLGTCHPCDNFRLPTEPLIAQG